jgi:tRNA (guanine-N7-)-methyltransferase
VPRKSFLVRHRRPDPPDEQTAAKYLLHWHTGDLYRAPETFPGLTSQHLFGNVLPMELEIGCGTGEYLCSLAQRNGDVNYVGLDTNLKSLFVAVETAHSLSLDNIRFIKAPVQFVYPLLEGDSLRAVYLHFPDPLLKPKYRKRQILTDEFLQHIHRALAPGGRLSIVTDNKELFDNILAMMEGDTRFERVHTESYAIGFEPVVKSRYQLYWESHNLPILRLELAKDGER